MEDRPPGPTFILFTDFGVDDIYVGQMKAALLNRAPRGVVIDLSHRAPQFDPRAAAHLLAALQRYFAKGVVFLAIVDPGVGGSREPIALEADGRWYVGPDNGLLSVIEARARSARTWRIVWRPEQLSASFHGRDLFAPMAAWIANGAANDRIEPIPELGVRLGAEDLAEIIYVDHYGNAITGVRADGVSQSAVLEARGHRLNHARVFADVSPGAAFWYENSIGLVEIAVNRGSAAASLHLAPGSPVRWVDPGALDQNIG